jgi:hypothetical protein
MRNRKKRVSPYTTLLDVCVATQQELARFFSQQGSCFGDLRRQRLLTGESEFLKAAKGFDRDAWTEEDRRFVESLMRRERGEVPESDWIDEYLMRTDLEARYSEGHMPRFSGGSRVTLSLHLEGGRDKRWF